MSQLGGLSRALVSESLRRRASAEGMQREAQQNELRMQELQIAQQQMTLAAQAEQAQAAQQARAQQQAAERAQQQRQFETEQRRKAQDAAALALSQQKNRQVDVVRSALSSGTAIDPAVAREFGIMQQAARARRDQSATAGRTPSQIAESLSPQLQARQPRITTVPAPLAATGAPPGVQGPQLATAAQALAQPTPVQPPTPSQLQALPPGTGVVTGPEGALAVRRPTSFQELTEDDMKAQAIEAYRQAGVSESRLRAIAALAPNLTSNQLINQLEDALPKPETIRRTDFQRAASKAQVRERETQAIIDSGDEDVIRDEAARFGMPAVELEDTEAHKEFLRRKVQRAQIVQQAASPSTVTAVNPQTGQRLALVNGQWVPAQ